ncbi:MAG TPA: hypothetical protein VGF18_06845, partial [Candidatus Tumulicola sp.]
MTFAGCSASGMSPSNATVAGPSVVSQHRAEADGKVSHATVARAAVRGWMSPQAKAGKNVIYWGDYNTSTITLFSNKGVNGPQLGQITEGLSEPERLFVDSQGSVYATNIGNNTVTAYKAGTTTPFLTISDGIDGPTGLAVDKNGTVYVANVDSDTITEYKKGKTSPSLTIDAAAEYLATDSNDNLYASEYPSIVEYPKGSSNGTSLNLSNLGSPGAIEIDKNAGIIVLDESNDNVDYFPAGQTQA